MQWGARVHACVPRYVRLSISYSGDVDSDFQCCRVSILPVMKIGDNRSGLPGSKKVTSRLFDSCPPPVPGLPGSDLSTRHQGRRKPPTFTSPEADFRIWGTGIDTSMSVKEILVPFLVASTPAEGWEPQWGVVL